MSPSALVDNAARYQYQFSLSPLLCHFRCRGYRRLQMRFAFAEALLPMLMFSMRCPCYALIIAASFSSMLPPLMLAVAGY